MQHFHEILEAWSTESLQVPKVYLWLSEHLVTMQHCGAVAMRWVSVSLPQVLPP